MRTLLFILVALIRTFVPLGLLVGAIWWLANGGEHPARFWWILGGVLLTPVVLYLAFAAWIAIGWLREGRRNLREAERNSRKP